MYIKQTRSRGDVSSTSSNWKRLNWAPITQAQGTAFSLKATKYKVSFRYNSQIGWIASTQEPKYLETAGQSKSDALYWLIRQIKKEYRKQISIDKTYLKLLDLRRQKNG